MFPLFETIKIENRILCNIGAHNERFNRSRKELSGKTDFIDLSQQIRIPDHLDNSKYKCRVVYSESIHTIEFQPYVSKKINSLQIVFDDEIEYSYKFMDRQALDQILKSVQADEVIIVKNGKVSDTSFSNIVLFDGNKWVTPSDCLLKGTCRSALLDSNTITCEEVFAGDIRRYQYIKLINAMNNMNDSPLIPIKNIRF